MSFQKEFKQLRDSYEPTVLKNPVLSKEQEQFIFAKIQTLKDRIFQICLKDSKIYESFLERVEGLLVKNNHHEVFMVGSFSSESEYDERVAHDVEYATKLVEMTKDETLSSIKKHHISHDIFSEALSEWKTRHSNKIVNAFENDMNYCINKLICSNIKIIIQIVSSYRSSDEMTVSDLFSEGFIGLRRAICLFNYNLGHKFSTYASQWIKSAIGRAISDKASLIRIPVNVHEQRREVDKLRKILSKELGRDPEDCEIIERMRKKTSNLAALETIFNYYQIDNSRPDLEFGGSLGICLEDNLCDSKIIEENDILTIKKAKNIIEEYINGIKNKNERYYLKYHFGINDTSDIKSKEEIIKNLEIDRREYDNIRKKAIANLKKKLASEIALLEAFNIAEDWESNSNLEYA